MVHHDHIRKCMGRMVICHTRKGNIHGHLVGFNGTHLILRTPRYGMVAGESQAQVQGTHAFGDQPNTVKEAGLWGGPGYGYGGGFIAGGGYGYGGGGYGYGFGNTAVALASVIGLTAIGLSAIFW